MRGANKPNTQALAVKTALSSLMQENKVNWSVVKSLTKQIVKCDEYDLVTPSIAMTFICIDAMATLTRPVGKIKVTRKDFIEWCNTYLKSNSKQKYQYSGKDVYAARCAFLHTYGTTAELHNDDPETLKFLYHDSEEQQHQLYIEDRTVVISTKLLVVDICKAVDSFIAECKNNPQFGERVSGRLDEVLITVPFVVSNQ